MHPALSLGLQQCLNAPMPHQQTFVFKQGADDHQAEMRFFPIACVSVRLVLYFKMNGGQLIFDQGFYAFGT